MADLSTLPNLGPQLSAWLLAAGIATRSALQAAGPVGAFLAVRQAGFRPSLNLLWALAAALEDRDWRSLTDAGKQALRRELAEAGR